MLSCDFLGFLTFFCIFAHKVDQTWFVLHESWRTTLFGIYYSVDVVRIENNSPMIEITCVLLRFYGFLSFFGTFAH